MIAQHLLSRRTSYFVKGILILLTGLWVGCGGGSETHKPGEANRHVLQQSLKFFYFDLFNLGPHPTSMFKTDNSNTTLIAQGDGVGNVATFRLRLLKDTLAIVEVQCIQNPGERESYFTTILILQPQGFWSFQVYDGQEGRLVFLPGRIEKEIDLDGDGINELVMKQVTQDQKKEEFHGSYYLAWRDSNTKYKIFHPVYLGSFWKRNSGPVLTQSVTLGYKKDGPRMVIESKVERGNSNGSVTRNLRWDGKELRIESGNQLTIRGKDIWVRETPKTGKVVMKLNEGDRCDVLRKGEFDVVKDVPDYWYKIKFKGQEGWVYGSQTDLKMTLEPLTTGNQIWAFLKKMKIEECVNQQNEVEFFDDFNEPVPGCMIEEKDDLVLQTRYNVDGFTSESYKLKVVDRDFIAVDRTSTTAAVQVCANHNTMLVSYTNGKLVIDEYGGTLDTLMIDGDTGFMINRSVSDCGSYYGFTGFEGESSWMVLAKVPGGKFKKIQEFGKVIVESQMLIDLKEGALFVDSAGMKIVSTEPLTVRVDEYLRKKNGERFDRAPGSNSHTYRWSAETKKFEETQPQ